MPSTTPISESQTSKSLPSGCLITFGGLFFFVGLFAFWNTFVVSMGTYMSARSWQRTPCTILTSTMEEHRGDDNATYQAKFSYEYHIAGVRYIGTKDTPFRFSGSRKAAEERLEALPVGMQTHCWVDPKRPEQALLDRSIVWIHMLAPLMVLICFCGLGGAIAYHGLRMRRQQLLTSRLANPPPTNTPPTNNLPTNHLNAPFPASLFSVDPAPNRPAPSDFSANFSANSSGPDGPSLMTFSQDAHSTAEDLADQRATVPQRLKPQQTRFARLLVVCFLALFWNGIVSVFLRALFVDPPFGTLWGQIGLGLFLIPFVLIGLALIGGCLHTLLSMFNPSVSVALSSGAAPLGGELDVAWEVSGGLLSLRRLNVVIIGQEWCRYVQGTDTKTDTSSFAVIDVCSTSDPREIPFGSRSVTIPLDTMHSFEALNNKIQWTVRVQGKIPWWPDVSEDFAFRVTPPARELG